jgi:polysaccharide biosynthesis/export protein
MTKDMYRSRARGIIAVAAVSLIVLIGNAANAQNRLATLPSDSPKADDTRPRSAANVPDSIDPYFKNIYRDFHETYKLGPEDEIAIRVVGQPDYSLERVQVSPFGRVYHPLIGEVDVAGMTVRQATERLTLNLSDFIINPKVTLSLLTANSAKVGVLGDVTRPGIIVMAKPMTILDAISASGGVTDYGSKSNITVLRPVGEGRLQTMKVNVKRILEGKATAEENVTLVAGDTVIVHGNFRKTLATITSLAGFGYFLRSVSR